jgi:hypothetical protein
VRLYSNCIDKSLSGTKQLNRNYVICKKISVDPTNLATRASLGLTLLLLGTIHDLGREPDNAQYLIQSIQHLNAVIRMAIPNDPINMAATHNLGLAHMALESQRSGKDSQYLDLVSSPQTPLHPDLDSSILLINKGAMLLQMGRADDAVSSLNAASQMLSCDAYDEALKSCDTSAADSRHCKACLLVQQNLMVAKSLLYEEPSIHVVADAGSSKSLDHDTDQAVEVEPTSDKYDNSDGESSGTKNETLTGSSLNSPSSSDTYNNHIETETRIAEEKDGLHSERKAVPELQTALQSLEDAARDGAHRPRLLLALAKARSST